MFGHLWSSEVSHDAAIHNQYGVALFLHRFCLMSRALRPSQKLRFEPIRNSQSEIRNFMWPVKLGKDSVKKR